MAHVYAFHPYKVEINFGSEPEARAFHDEVRRIRLASARREPLRTEYGPLATRRTPVRAVPIPIIKPRTREHQPRMSRRTKASGERMARFWDRRAQEDAFYFVDNAQAYRQADSTRFWADAVITADALCRGRHNASYGDVLVMPTCRPEAALGTAFRAAWSA